MSNDAARFADLERRIRQLERLVPPHVTAAEAASGLEAEAAARADADAAEAAERGAADDALDARLDPVETKLATYPNDYANVLADTAPPNVAATSALGVSTQAAREDHTHGIPYGSTPAVVSAAAGSAGTSANVAHEDHAHQVSTGTPGAVTAGASASAGTGTALALATHVHSVAVGTPVAVTPDAAASAGSGGAFAHSNHQHGLTTYSSTPAAVAASGSAGTSGAAPARGDHAHAHGDQAGGSLHADAVAGGASGFLNGTEKSKLSRLESVLTGITAAGSTQGTATVITQEFNDVTTVASGTGVVPDNFTAVGVRRTVRNRGANFLAVYPPSGCAIDSLATNAAYSLSQGSTMTLVWVSSTLLIALHQDVSVTSVSASGATNGMSWSTEQVLNLHVATGATPGVIAASGSQAIGAQLQMPAGSTIAQTALTSCTLGANYVSYDANSAPRVYLDPTGRVCLTGGVKRSSGSVVGGETLCTIPSSPSGMRPLTRSRFFTTQCFGAVVNITIDTGGVISVNTVGGATGTPASGIWFDGISFDPRA